VQSTFVHVGISQMPVCEPGVPKKQLPPQQSALIVQTPWLGTQAAWQMPFTHGVVLQQSAEVAQVPPALLQGPLRRHRGTPSSSGWQHSSGVLWQLAPGNFNGEQQSLATLHAATLASEPTLQIPPGLEQEFSPAHRPRTPASGLAPEHVLA
jgi:hypothetical protein